MFSEGNDGKGKDTNQFQSVSMVLRSVSNDGSMRHPLGYSDVLSFLHIPLYPGEFQHVRMRLCAPEGNFIAKSLEKNW